MPRSGKTLYVGSFDEPYASHMTDVISLAGPHGSGERGGGRAGPPLKEQGSYL